MSITTVSRLSGFALLFGALFALIGYGLTSFQSNDPTMVTSLPYLLTGVLLWLGSLLLVLGLPTAYSASADRLGALGLAGYVITMLLLLTNHVVYNALRVLVFPLIFSDALLMARLTATQPVVLFFAIGLFLQIVGPLLLGLAIVRQASALPRWLGILLIASGIDTLRDLSPITNPPIPVIGVLSFLLFFGACAGWGLVLLRSQRETQPLFNSTASFERAVGVFKES